MKKSHRLISVFLLVGLLSSLCMGCDRKNKEEIYNETNFTYRYELEKTEYKPGNLIQITVEMINDSSYPSVYIGEDHFRPQAELVRRVYITNDVYCDYTVIYAGNSIDNSSVTRKEMPPGGSQTTRFIFQIPEDAPGGEYSLRLSYKNETKTFLNVFTLVTPMPPVHPDTSSNILEIGSGELSEEKLKQVITEYRDNYTNIVPEKGSSSVVSFETDFEAVSCSVSRLSPVDDTDITVELNGYIDLYVGANCSGTTVTVPIDWWYRDNAKNDTVWSYLVNVKDTGGNLHWYYFRVDYSQ